MKKHSYIFENENEERFYLQDVSICSPEIKIQFFNRGWTGYVKVFNENGELVSKSFQLKDKPIPFEVPECTSVKTMSILRRVGFKDHEEAKEWKLTHFKKLHGVGVSEASNCVSAVNGSEKIENKQEILNDLKEASRVIEREIDQERWKEPGYESISANPDGHGGWEVPGDNQSIHPLITDTDYQDWVCFTNEGEDDCSEYESFAAWTAGYGTAVNHVRIEITETGECEIFANDHSLDLTVFKKPNIETFQIYSDEEPWLTPKKVEILMHMEDGSIKTAVIE